MSTKTAVQWNEDGSATLLARIMARNGSGAVVTGEGKWTTQADFASITCKVFDRTTADTEVTPAPTIVISSVIIDTPVTDGAIWTADDTGYNFAYDIAGTYFPTGGHIYRVEFFATMTGGTTTFWWEYEGEAIARIGG